MSLEPEADTLSDNAKTRQRSEKYKGSPLNSQPSIIRNHFKCPKSHGRSSAIKYRGGKTVFRAVVV